jgi:XTP/dITP diphosphohydrolase
MINKLVFATNNKHKIEELKHAVNKRFEIIGLKEIGCTEEIPETSPTVAGNALQKASYIHDKYGYDCFADDTSLEIDALNGRPGIYSARYAGLGKNFDDNMNKVLEELAGKTNRTARFRTVIALIMKGQEYLFEGIVEGQILTEKKGTEGFGYDPIFQPEGFNKTFAQMNLDEKNQISHRGRAVKKLTEFLETIKEN